MVPAKAALPQTLDPPPRTISTFARLRRGIFVHVTHPPKGSLIGTPSIRTRVRLAPFGPRLRRETPCVVGLAESDPARRNRLKAAEALRVSSIARAGIELRSVALNTSTAIGNSDKGRATLVALTTKGSSVWAPRLPTRQPAIKIAPKRFAFILKSAAIKYVLFRFSVVLGDR